MGKRMCKTSYSRKKTKVEMVTARQCEINERNATTYKEGRDHGKAEVDIGRVCLRVNKSCSKKVSQQN